MDDHNWKNIKNTNRRKCTNCGIEQSERIKYEGKEIIKYWAPKINQCKPKTQPKKLGDKS